MSLTDNQKYLIKAISENRLDLARRVALSCLEEDKTQKNKVFCDAYKRALEKPVNKFIELPNHLKGILCAEDVSKTFKEKRYYISDREKKIFDNIIKSKKVNDKLMEMGIPYLNSTLLFGDSGTGKTTFGKYVAYKMNLPFCYLNFSRLVDSYMGGTSKNISEAFKYAINNPCVFMLDEVDCISIERSSSNDSGPSGEMARITITLMQEFDKLSNDIVVLGATNRIDRIDKALLRRFSIRHEVKMLSYKERVEMINMYLSDINFVFSDEVIHNIAEPDRSQAELINKLIRLISNKIYVDMNIDLKSV